MFGVVFSKGEYCLLLLHEVVGLVELSVVGLSLFVVVFGLLLFV